MTAFCASLLRSPRRSAVMTNFPFAFRMATAAFALASVPLDLTAQASSAPAAPRSTTLLTLADSLLHPEGIAWDARRQRWLISSVRQRKVVAVDGQGAARDFVASGQDGLDAVLAIAVDPGRDLLWVTSAALPQMQGYSAADAGRSRLLAFDLATGTLRRRVTLPGQENHTVGDLTVAPDGSVYASDNFSGAMYRVDLKGDTAALLVAPGQGLRSPQGIVPDGTRLLVADYSRGIRAVDLATGRVTPLVTPGGDDLRGIDGLVRVGDRILLGIQNGASPPQVVRLTLSQDGASLAGAEVADRPVPAGGDPTQGVVVDGAFVYVANSPWSNYADDGTILPGARWPRPLLLRLPLR